MKKRDRMSRLGATYGKLSAIGWWNWYMSRGRIDRKALQGDTDMLKRDFRMISNRRAL